MGKKRLKRRIAELEDDVKRLSESWATVYNAAREDRAKLLQHVSDPVAYPYYLADRERQRQLMCLGLFGDGAGTEVRSITPDAGKEDWRSGWPKELPEGYDRAEAENYTLPPNIAPPTLWPSYRVGTKFYHPKHGHVGEVICNNVELSGSLRHAVSSGNIFVYKADDGKLHARHEDDWLHHEHQQFSPLVDQHTTVVGTIPLTGELRPTNLPYDKPHDGDK